MKEAEEKRMTLREQLLSELRRRNEIVQKKIKEIESQISSYTLFMSTITGGAFSGTAKRSCEYHKNELFEQKERVIQQNSWISEMLSKYEE